MCVWTYLSCNEDRQGTGQRKNTSWFDRCDDSINLDPGIRLKCNPARTNVPVFIYISTYRFTTEWLPNNRTILDGVFCVSARGNHSSLANIHHVHYANHKVVTRTPTFFLLIQSSNEVFPHIRSEEGRMQGNHLGLFFQEKHRGGFSRSV